MFNFQEWEKPVSLFPSFASINLEEIQRRLKEKTDELKKKLKKVTEVIITFSMITYKEKVTKQFFVLLFVGG